MSIDMGPWPYGKLENSADWRAGSIHYIVQATEDGYYGFAFRGQQEVASMVGPHRSRAVCEKSLKAAAPPGMFG